MRTLINRLPFWSKVDCAIAPPALVLLSAYSGMSGPMTFRATLTAGLSIAALAWVAASVYLTWILCYRASDIVIPAFLNALGTVLAVAFVIPLLPIYSPRMVTAFLIGILVGWLFCKVIGAIGPKPGIARPLPERS